MNEKIRELLLQAREETREGNWKPPTAVWTERFVELIVREHIAVWEAMDNGNAVEGYLEMEDYPLAISKRFGIGTK